MVLEVYRVGLFWPTPFFLPVSCLGWGCFDPPTITFLFTVRSSRNFYTCLLNRTTFQKIFFDNCLIPMTSSMTSSILKIENFHKFYKSHFLTDFDDPGWKLKLRTSIFRKNIFAHLLGGYVVIKRHYHYFNVKSHLWRHKWRHRDQITKTKIPKFASLWEVSKTYFVFLLRPLWRHLWCNKCFSTLWWRHLMTSLSSKKCAKIFFLKF